MPYLTGEIVRVGDLVEYSLGGILLEVTVVAVAQAAAVAPGYEWFVAKAPDGVLIAWSKPGDVARIFRPSDSETVHRSLRHMRMTRISIFWRGQSE